MRKVAITSNTSWYLYNFRRNTIKALLAEGYLVYAIAPEDTYSRKLAEFGCEYIPIHIDQGGTNPVADFKTCLNFISCYRKYRPDVILNFTPKNNIYSTIAATFFSIPCINNIAGLGLVFIEEGITARIARLLYRISQPRARKIFFQNQEDRKLFLESNITSPELTDRLPGSGVDLARFSVQKAPDNNQVRFLLVARMLYDKGIAQYVEAARILKKKHSNIEFCILGFLDVNHPSAVSKETMQSWQFEGVINYLGTSDNVEEEIAIADCIVLPSHYREGVPKSLLEGGAMGKPLVTTDNVGCRDVVDDGLNGFLCTIKDTEDIAQKLEKILLMSHVDRLIMGENSRRKIEQEFDEKIVINKYLVEIRSIFLQEF